MEPQLMALLFVGAVALIVLLRRFSGGRYGTVRPSEVVTVADLAFRVDPAFTYHFSGPAHEPEALLALDRHWTLVKSLWRPLAFSDEAMAALVSGMQAQAFRTLTALQGYEMLDDRGRVIGHVVARAGFSATLWIVGENRVAISTPTTTTDEGR